VLAREFGARVQGIFARLGDAAQRLTIAVKEIERLLREMIALAEGLC
jgi:hypothetical protein